MTICDRCNKKLRWFSYKFENWDRGVMIVLCWDCTNIIMAEESAREQSRNEILKQEYLRKKGWPK